MKEIIKISIENSRIRGRVCQANGVKFSKRVVLPPTGEYGSHILLISEDFVKPDTKKEGHSILYFYPDRDVILSRLVPVTGSDTIYEKVKTTPQKLRDSIMGNSEKKEYQFSKDYINELKSNINILDFIKDRSGFSFKQQGSDYYRCEQHDSLVINIKTNRFFWNSQGLINGDVITYLTEVDHLHFNEALGVLDSYYKDLPIDKRTKTMDHAEKKEFVLPKKAASNQKVRDYLINTRCLDKKFIDLMIEDGLLYQDEKSNAVFICQNSQGIVDSAFLRSTYSHFRGNPASPNKFTGLFLEICPGASKLVLTEAFIDGISYYTLKKNKGETIDFNLLACDSSNCISETFRRNYLQRSEINQHVDTVIIATDNDEAGKKVYPKIKEDYAPYFSRIKSWEEEYPIAKDWNEDLVNSMNDSLNYDKALSK